MPILSEYLRRTRTRLIAPHIGGDILDIGCGRAAVLRRYGDRIRSYCGVDANQATIRELQAEFPDQQFLVRDLETDRLDFDARFDCVVMLAIVEHIFNQKFLMAGVAQALRPDGHVVLTTPTPFGNDIVHRCGAMVGLFHQSATDDHIVLYNRRRLRLLAKEVGLDLVSHRYFQLRCNQIAIMAKPSAVRRIDAL